jgi:hydrogenase expression/formation protein HypC
MSAEPVEIRTGAACDLLEDCITCGDVAVPVTVVAVSGVDARCRDAEGREETVAIELVGVVAPGDRLLVHARVAIARIEDEEAAP